MSVERVISRYTRIALDLSPNDIERWKKDLRVMTKVYKSIGLDGDAKDLETWEEAEKLFLTFRNNFERWAYKVVLPKVEKGSEPYLYKDVQKQAWDAMHTIRELFPTIWGGEGQKRIPDFSDLRHEREKNITRYNKAFNTALKTISDFISEQKDKSRSEDEKHNIAGMNVLVQGYNRAGNDEDLDNVLARLERCAAPIARAGFKSAISGVKLVVDFDPKPGEGLTNAQYSPSEDRMKVYPLGLVGRGFDGFEGTFTHEMGHRYWFKEMTGQGRAYWEEVMTKNTVKIESSDVKALMKLVEPGMDESEMLHIIDRQDMDELDKAKLRGMTHVRNFDLKTKQEYEDRLENLMVGEPVLLEDVSEYAASGGPIEAFAEAFKAYVLKGPGSLGPVTLDLFKKVVSSGGVKLAKVVGVETEDSDLEYVLESLISHGNHNKRLPSKAVILLKGYLSKGQHLEFFVSPERSTVFRGDHTTAALFERDTSLKDKAEGSDNLILHLEPGSSWTTDLGQAQYHASGDANHPLEVLYEAKTSVGTWLDMRLLYKLSQLRGLRLEKEVICLDAKVQCQATWTSKQAAVRVAERSKKVNLGYRVVDLRTGEAYSKILPKKDKPKLQEQAKKLHSEGKNVGVQTVEVHVPESWKKGEDLEPYAPKDVLEGLRSASINPFSPSICMKPMKEAIQALRVASVIARHKVASLEVGKWYKHKHVGETYFLVKDKQKNGGWAGLKVVFDRAHPKAKKDSIRPGGMGSDQWSEIAEKDLPAEIKAAV